MPGRVGAKAAGGCWILVAMVALCHLGHVACAMDVISTRIGFTIFIECRRNSRRIVLQKITRSAQTTLVYDGRLKADLRPPEKYELQLSKSGFLLYIRSVAIADEGDYHCFDVSDPEHKDITRVVVYVRPGSPRLQSLPNPLIEGTTVSLTCVSEGGKPTPHVFWTMRVPRRSEPLTLRSTSRIFNNTNGTSQVFSELLLPVTRKLAQSHLYCNAAEKTTFYSEQLLVPLTVHLKPLIPVLNYTGLPVREGDTLVLECNVRGARPESTIQWTLHNGTQELSLTPSSTNHTLCSDGTINTTSRVAISISGRHSAARVTCAAENTVTRYVGHAKINSSVLLNVWRMFAMFTDVPVLAILHTATLKTERDNATPQCTVSSNPPVLEVFWQKMDTGVRLIGSRYSTQLEGHQKSTLSIHNLTWSDVGLYRCVGRNQIGTGFSAATRLDLRHSPVCDPAQKLKYGAAIGRQISIACHVFARPNNVSFHWTFPNGTERTTRKRLNPSPGMTYNASDEVTYAVRSMKDYGAVLCNTSNAIGLPSHTCELEIVPTSPAEAPKSCTVHNTSSSSSAVLVVCIAGFDGGSLAHHALQLRPQSSGVFQTVLNNSNGSFLVEGLRPNSPYRYRVCSSNALFWRDVACTPEGSILIFQNISGDSMPHGYNADREKMSQSVFLYLLFGGAGVAFLVCAILGALILICCQLRRKKFKATGHFGTLSNSAALTFSGEELDNRENAEYMCMEDVRLGTGKRTPEASDAKLFHQQIEAQRRFQKSRSRSSSVPAALLALSYHAGACSPYAVSKGGACIPATTKTNPVDTKTSQTLPRRASVDCVATAQQTASKQHSMTLPAKKCGKFPRSNLPDRSILPPPPPPPAVPSIAGGTQRFRLASAEPSFPCISESEECQDSGTSQTYVRNTSSSSDSIDCSDWTASTTLAVNSVLRPRADLSPQSLKLPSNNVASDSQCELTETTSIEENEKSSTNGTSDSDSDESNSGEVRKTSKVPNVDPSRRPSPGQSPSAKKADSEPEFLIELPRKPSLLYEERAIDVEFTAPRGEWTPPKFPTSACLASISPDVRQKCGELQQPEPSKPRVYGRRYSDQPQSAVSHFNRRASERSPIRGILKRPSLSSVTGCPTEL